MDEITQVKTRYRMEQWTQLIKECQTSGMSVKSWCQQNDIKESAYYYRLKQIRQEACVLQMPALHQGNQRTMEFAKLRVEREPAEYDGAVILHLPFATVEVKEGASQKIIEAVLLALKAQC